ncbi:glucosyltransferase [Aliidiomarina iranensis]|uniref:Glucosyltransferase n=1 Tax=Aliidiomarina iranensis TaxID=1434071 RepID=A0A432VTA4_9GAMM|nr:glycosyltransferase [Aliidiomarina iranensis]RUO19617.1 glucosyltransferase [Aliidiomarina iranensis]
METMDRRVLHFVSGNLSGGAAKGALLLHNSLLNLGVNSFIITSSRIKVDAPNILYLNDRFQIRLLARKIFDKLIPLMFGAQFSTPLSMGVCGMSVKELKAIIRESDIIHLHWINSGFVDLNVFAKFSNDIVWTLRDMWPFTGLCHYTHGCEKFKVHCYKCPQLASSYVFDLVDFLFKRRLAVYRKLNFKVAIGISDWISDQARSSSLLRGVPVHTISNTIDFDNFDISGPRKLARTHLGISTKCKVILIGAVNLKSPYKGLDLFIESLQSLNSEEYLIVTFGALGDKSFIKYGFKCLHLGVLNNEELREAYNAADVFVAPSKMDAFAKTVAEALACGTPVVCFDNSGPSEIVVHGLTGYHAKAFNVIDLAFGISWVCREITGDHGRQLLRNSVLTRFSPSVLAEQYKEVYKKL